MTRFAQNRRNLFNVCLNGSCLLGTGPFLYFFLYYQTYDEQTNLILTKLHVIIFRSIIIKSILYNGKDEIHFVLDLKEKKIEAFSPLNPKERKRSLSVSSSGSITFQFFGAIFCAPGSRTTIKNERGIIVLQYFFVLFCFFLMHISIQYPGAQRFKYVIGDSFSNKVCFTS